MRRNYSNLEKVHDGISFGGDRSAKAGLDTKLAGNLRKENKQLNELLKETIRKNEMLLKRVGAIEKEQKMVSY